jgi:prepilin-type N-terminal cleavage/methylation domain-containing protein/prepilin-type processing-associated H-X9-DG protein
MTSTPYSISSPGRSARSAAFTLIELLTVIAIIGILAAILIPAVNGVRNSVKKSQCTTNVRQWTQAVLLYANEHKGAYALRATANDGATNAYWNEIHNNVNSMLYGPYFERFSNISNARTCPSYETPAGTNPIRCYSMNRPYIDSKNNVAATNAISLRAISNPARMLLMVETEPSVDGGTNANPWFIGKGDLTTKVSPMFTDGTKQRHGNAVTASFADGHVTTITLAEVQQNGDQWCRLY